MRGFEGDCYREQTDVRGSKNQSQFVDDSLSKQRYTPLENQNAIVIFNQAAINLSESIHQNPYEGEGTP